MATLGLFYYMWAFSSCGEQGPIPGCDARASHCGGFSCAAQTLGTWASVVVVLGLRRSMACAIFPDQG